MPTIQIRDKLTGRVIVQKQPPHGSSMFYKQQMARDLAREAGISNSPSSPYNYDDVYVTEMAGNVCLDKWEI